MWKLTVPNDVLEKLRCSLCKEYLSQLPVYSYPDQEGVGCGRCPVISDQNPIRDVSYEAVAKYLFFPCRYKPYGCIENVLPKDMQDHEESCSYRQYFCPFIPLASCPWQGPFNELFAHYDEQHKVLALHNPKFEINWFNMYEDNYLLSHGEDLFIIHIKCDARENIFWCSVRYIGSKKRANRFLFQIELANHGGGNKIVLTTKQVDCDGNMCLNKDAAVHMDTAEIRKALEDPCSIICTVNISPNEANCNNLNSGFMNVKNRAVVSNDVVDEDILRELECPICNEYMVPPIHQCVAGHSMCSSCRKQITECPTCRDSILETRNFSLEKLTRLIKYSCKYRDYDCTYISTSDSIRKHEAECKFGPYDCPFRTFYDCKWKGKLSDIITHSQMVHEDNVLVVEVITWVFQQECDDHDCLIVKAHGDVFRLLFKFDSECWDVYWNMQLIGPAEEAAKYQFEIDIIDNSELEQRLFMRKNCNRLTKDKDAFRNGESFIRMPYDLISPFMNNKDLIYKCHIVKK